MKLSEVPPRVTRIVLATSCEEVDEDEEFAARRVTLRDAWGDMELEQDEPLPAIYIESWLALKAPGCLGWKEAGRLLVYDGKPPVRERLEARYEDVYQRELRRGCPVPDFEEWAPAEAKRSGLKWESGPRRA